MVRGGRSLVVELVLPKHRAGVRFSPAAHLSSPTLCRSPTLVGLDKYAIIKILEINF